MEFNMEQDDRSAVLAAMYQEDDPAAITDLKPNTNMSHRSRKIRVGAIVYDVPTIEYVQQLENMMLHQTQTVERLQRVIDRLTAMLSKSRNNQQGQTRQLDDLRRELGKKITRRETP
jgi:hypothetical protein